MSSAVNPDANKLCTELVGTNYSVKCAWGIRENTVISILFRIPSNIFTTVLAWEFLQVTQQTDG